MSEREKDGVFLHGKHIDLLPINKDHLKIYVAWANNFKVRRYNRSAIPSTIEEYEKWLESDDFVEQKDDFHLEIRHKLDQKPIGMVGFNHINWTDRNGNIGVFIGDPDYWGMNLCPEVIKLFLNYIFEELNLHKVTAEIFNINKRSFRCAEKSGMKYEGTLKDEVYIDGEYYDCLYYSILKREWEENNK